MSMKGQVSPFVIALRFDWRLYHFQHFPEGPESYDDCDPGIHCLSAYAVSSYNVVLNLCGTIDPER